jgi:hypothetical protein
MMLQTTNFRHLDDFTGGGRLYFFAIAGRPSPATDEFYGYGNGRNTP